MYSYAFLIPVISAYLIWLRRDTLHELKVQPSYVTGSFLLTAGLSALIIGQAGGISVLQQVSLMLTIPAMVLLVFGKAVLKALALPISFLWFMIPIWEILTDPLHLPFQAFSANMGVMLLRIAGIPVFQDGLFIHLPNITLEVARACSGVNYLIAVLATSIPLSTIVLTSMRRRVTLVLLAVTVSALANSLRVALIGLLAYYDMSGDLHGPYHALHGIFVSMVGYLVIFGGLWILSRNQHDGNPRPFPSPVSEKKGRLEWNQQKTSLGFLIAVLLLAGSTPYIDRSRPVPLRHSLSGLSLVSAGWVGRDVPYEHIPGVDQSLSRIYRHVSGEEVHVSVSYFETQTQGKELVGPGTAKLHSDATRVRMIVGQRGEVEMNRLLRHEGGRAQAVLFWYDLNGRIVPGRYAAKLYTAFDAVANGRTSGALVSLATALPSDDEPARQRALESLSAFVSTFYPILDQYLPDPAEDSLQG